MKTYRTPAREGKSEETVKRSTFLGAVWRIASEQDAQERIAAEKKRHPDARHCAWAFVLGKEGDCLRYADDGEPQGTAGQPILEVIRKRGLTDTLVCVTRYFGGILLGAGGLTRAYALAAADALTDAGTTVMLETVRARLTVDYPRLARLKNALEKDGCVKIEQTVFSSDADMTVLVQRAAWEDFCARIADLSGGSFAPRKTETVFLPWEE